MYILGAEKDKSLTIELEQQESLCVAGDEGTGKTEILLYFAMQLADKGKRVLYVQDRLYSQTLLNLIMRLYTQNEGYWETALDNIQENMHVSFATIPTIELDQYMKETLAVELEDLVVVTDTQSKDNQYLNELKCKVRNLLYTHELPKHLNVYMQGLEDNLESKETIEDEHRLLLTNNPKDFRYEGVILSKDADTVSFIYEK